MVVPRRRGNRHVQQRWWPFNNCANPPFDLINPVLEQIVEQDAAATVILPVWQAHPFWHRTTPMAADAYLLPADCGLTATGRDKRPRQLPHWRLAAFRFLPVARGTLPDVGDGSRTTAWRVPPPSRALARLPFAASTTRR